jgi:hypothetical protein
MPTGERVPNMPLTPTLSPQERGEGGHRSVAEAAGWGIMANEIARGLRKRTTPQEVKLTLINDTLRKPPPGRASLGHPPPLGEG